MASNQKVKANPQTFSSGGLYGSSRTDKYGTTYNPSDFEQKLIGMTNNYIPQYLEQMANPTYDSQIFKAQTAQRNRLANQSFENNLMNPLASRGLTRGSSINQMGNQFANKLADLEVDAMANDDARNANVLNNMFNYYQIPYNHMKGISNFSNQQYQQAVQDAMRQNALNANNMGDLANMSGGMSNLAMSAAKAGGGLSGLNAGGGLSGLNAGGMNWGSLLGTAAGAYFGGPSGAQVGSALGGQFGSMW